MAFTPNTTAHTYDPDAVYCSTGRFGHRLRRMHVFSSFFTALSSKTGGDRAHFIRFFYTGERGPGSVGAGFCSSTPLWKKKGAKLERDAPARNNYIFCGHSTTYMSAFCARFYCRTWRGRGTTTFVPGSLWAPNEIRVPLFRGQDINYEFIYTYVCIRLLRNFILFSLARH